MEKTDSNIGTGQDLENRIPGKDMLEMQDVLSLWMPSFYRRAYRYLGNAADAEDAIQDAFLSACRRLGQFRGQSKMSTWLTTIVINSSITQLRRRPRQVHLSLDERLGEEEQGYCLSERLADGKPSPETECMNSEMHGHLMRCVAELPPSLRRAFQLRELDGKTISEAAGILGVANVTVKAQVSRARAKLRRMIAQTLDGRVVQPRPELHRSRRRKGFSHSNKMQVKGNREITI
jgi:RNA polymerase sigma-70 factor (ECF subfamily)